MARNIHHITQYHPETGEKLLRMNGICTVTGKLYGVTVSAAAHDRWRAGELIQDAFPELDDDQREFVKSGMTPAEWEKIFPAEEQEPESKIPALYQLDYRFSDIDETRTSLWTHPQANLSEEEWEEFLGELFAEALEERDIDELPLDYMINQLKECGWEEVILAGYAEIQEE